MTKKELIEKAILGLLSASLVLLILPLSVTARNSEETTVHLKSLDQSRLLQEIQGRLTDTIPYAFINATPEEEVAIFVIRKVSRWESLSSCFDYLSQEGLKAVLMTAQVLVGSYDIPSMIEQIDKLILEQAKELIRE